MKQRSFLFRSRALRLPACALLLGKRAQRTAACALLLLAAAVSISAADSPRVSRAVLSSSEKSLDDRIKALWEDNPLALVGATRGLYLDGYGAVFTAEVNPISGPLALFHGANYTKEEKDRYFKKRKERIPQLVTALKQTLAASAVSLDPIPANEQLVIAVVLDHNTWEDVSGLPGQLMVQGTRGKILEAQRSGNAAALDQAIRVTEY